MLYELVALSIESAANIPHQLRINPGGLEAAHLLEQRTVHQHLAGIQPYAIEPIAQSAGHLERGPHAIVVEVDQADELHPGSICSANFRVASTVSPLYAAISACGTVPTPWLPHQEACASVETPMAPATCAA